MTAGGEGFVLGEPAPELKLPDTDGRTRSLAEAEGAPAAVVIWTCIHCPYARAWHGRLADAARDYSPRGVRFFAVNSNDGDRYPADSFEGMRKRVAEEDWPFPFLHDEDQDTARAWDANVTPHVFVLDSERRLRYQGAPDADHADRSQNASWLRDALDAVLEGEAVERAETDPVGCSVKWKRD
ncbi:MAG: thioredoxin family protein [Solirubrobacterales bacterium]